MLSQIINSFNVLISRLSIPEKRICDHEDRSLDIIQTNKQIKRDKKSIRENKNKKLEQGIQEFWNNIK